MRPDGRWPRARPIHSFTSIGVAGGGGSEPIAALLNAATSGKRRLPEAGFCAGSSSSPGWWSLVVSDQAGHGPLEGLSGRQVKLDAASQT